MKPKPKDLVAGDIWRSSPDWEFIVLEAHGTKAKIKWTSHMKGESIVNENVEWSLEYTNVTPETVIAKRILNSYEATN
jgi:hypothetical protein